MITKESDSFKYGLAVVILGLVAGIGAGTVINGDLGSNILSETERNPSIGMALPLTSDIAFMAQPISGMSNMVVEDVNEAGGVKGENLNITVEDTQGEQTAAVNAVNKLIDVDNVNGLIGPMYSKTASAAIPIAADKKTPMISPSTTGTEIDELEDDGYFFRTVGSSIAMAKATAQMAEDENWNNASLLVVNDAYGDGLSEEFKAEYSGEVVEEVTYSEDATTFRSELETIQNSNSEVVILIGYSQVGSVILQQAYETGAYQENNWLVSEAVLNPEYLRDIEDEDGNDVLEGLRGVKTNGEATGPAYDDFQTSYEDHFGEDPPQTPFITEAYDSFVLLTLAMQRADTLEGPDVRDSMRPVANPPGKEVTTIEGGLEALRNGEEINYQGASSKITLNEDGSDISTVFAKSTYVNGSIQFGENLTVDE